MMLSFQELPCLGYVALPDSYNHQCITTLQLIKEYHKMIQRQIIEACHTQSYNVEGTGSPCTKGKKNWWSIESKVLCDLKQRHDKNRINLPSQQWRMKKE